MKPKVSVIIVNYNTKEITHSCILSVKKYIKDVQIILIDNASTDGSREFFSNNKDIKYIYNSNNLGFSKGNNLGAKYALSDFLLFLNSDTQLLDTNFNRALTYYANNNVGILAPKLLNSNGTIQDSCFHNQSLTNAFKEYFLKQRKTFSKYSPSVNIPTKVSNVVGAALLIAKDFFNEIGGWDERYFMYYEDMESCRQTSSHNKKIIYYPSWAIYHHHGASISNKKNSNLINSSKMYHGKVKYYFLTSILWLGQKI